MLQLESFANELLLDIFEFLSTTHLLHAFLDLNSRFNHLLYAHFEIHQLNFQSINKKSFDIICEKHLPILINHLTSIRLCNNDETPNIDQLFFTDNFTLNRFIHLKTLSLYHINCYPILNQFHHLSSLENLYLIDCQISNQQNDLIKTINNIWSIPNLVYCKINNIIVDITWICRVSIISSTLEYLSINKIEGDISSLYYLCKSAPHLQRLNIDVIQWSSHRQPKISFSSLISLKTSFRSQTQSTIEFLKKLPNLYSFTIEISDNLTNGYEWETFIRKYFPKLKIFHLKLNFRILTQDLLTKLDQLVDSFRTSFWIEKHQWYIQCDYYRSLKYNIGILYTLPYAFDEYSYLNTYYSVSTKPEQDEFYSHQYVRHVNQQNISIDSFKNFQLLNTRFPNIQHIDIKFPFIDDSNTYTLSKFNHLTTLTVILNNNFGYEQLQELINRARQLYSLKFNSFGGSIEGLFQLKSSSIRRLDLIQGQIKHGLFFNQNDCLDLINSLLGKQCEVLIVELDNENDIFILIENMLSLRVVTFRLKNDIFLSNLVFQSEHRKLIRALETNLSPKCLIDVDSKQRPKISIWIYRETNQSFLENDDYSIANIKLYITEFYNRRYLYLFLFFLSCYLLFY